MGEPFVQLSGIRKTMQRQVIIQDLHLSAERGEIVALCGGNGAGKSTILRMLAGVMQPDQGDIVVGGLRWRENRLDYAGQIGYMPDDYRFSPGLTASETMRFWAGLRGLSAARAREVLSEVGLTETGRKAVSAFSKGMRQRILFAQALLARPPLLIMDEPTNGLDPYWMESFAELVRQAAAAGQTVIFSTHQLPLAEGLADRIAFLRGGVIELEGTPARIREQLGSEGLQEAFASLFGFPVGRPE
ncbi:ABC transporter ATP-binding protein [Paenibacillus daejeonensis]|uniref:ABC transporter ATP-binding protein n=1 Tax=Paenibacillus daejeonensis TaxID=135193 RepID=UPI000364DE66|nr:ABC transporter ATP-binding protein [Paenibacillus daejeonensis]